ncbi:MAG: hypothetical protein ABIV39_07665, partial [Verrucomicrobiota bacterium]
FFYGSQLVSHWRVKEILSNFHRLHRLHRLADAYTPLIRKSLKNLLQQRPVVFATGGEHGIFAFQPS